VLKYIKIVVNDFLTHWTPCRLGTKTAENGDGLTVTPSWCMSGSIAPCGILISKFCTNLAMNMKIFISANFSPGHFLLPIENKKRFLKFEMTKKLSSL